jgi:hypothetical protein
MDHNWQVQLTGYLPERDQAWIIDLYQLAMVVTDMRARI